MDDGNGECDVSHSISSDGFLCYFYSASVAYDAFVSDSFIFSAGAFSVACGSEYFFAEETVSFGAEGAIVDGFGLSDFAFGAVENIVG